MKREGYWLVAIIVLIGLAIAGVVIPKTWHFGLDIDGGVRAVLQAQPKPGQKVDLGTIEQIISNRLNSSGVAATTVQQQPPDELIVELPFVHNQDALIQQLQATAQLEFRWFRALQDPEVPGQNARYVSNIVKDAQDRDSYVFFDKQTSRQFHDQAHILQSFQSFIGNTKPRPGATAFTVPSPLQQTSNSPASLYLTPAEQTTVTGLNQELEDWQTFTSDAISPVIMTGNDIQNNAVARFDPQMNQPVVDLTATQTGAAKWANFTRVHNSQTDPTGENMTGIILDGRVLSAPRVNDAILDGNTEISGGFKNAADAQDLANLLNAGALPVPLKIVEVTSVDPTLGHKPVQAMEFAGIIGGIAVLIFMAGYYLLPGLVADLALLIYTLFALAIFKAGIPWFNGQVFVPPITLTLPGIAAFILSVGMAVDANILIFERLKEELRNGKALRPAIDAGFKRAFTAIRDSNACTIITCIILAWLGTPDVKGFAVTLAIGVLLSLFTAITVTRTLLYLLVDAGVGNNPALFGLRRQWGYTGVRPETEQQTQRTTIIGKRNWFYGLSLLIIIPGIIFWSIGGLKKNIEFAGGTMVEAVFTKSVPQATVEHALVAAGFKDNLVQMGTSPTGGSIAFASVRDRSPDAYVNVENALNAVGTPFTVQSHRLVGGVISEQLTQNAISSVVLAALLIVCYLAIVFAMAGQGTLSLEFAMIRTRALAILIATGVLAVIVLGAISGWHYDAFLFKVAIGVGVACAALFTIGCLVAGFRFGTSAIIALLHDVLVLIGSFAILGYFLNWQIDSMFIVATLTVVGFSVHDTIVIFDRLRENLHRRLRGESFEELANRSIMQSLARSINTSFTVILTLVAMLIFGEASTRLLIAALLIGIVSGTYSSIFNATPILVDWERWIAKLRGPTLATAGGPPVREAPVREPAARASGGSTRPIRSANGDGTTAPVVESTSEEAQEEAASSDNRPAIRNRPKKRPSRRF